MKKIAKMILIGYLACQSIVLQAQILVIDGKKVDYQLPPISLYVNKQLVQTTVMAPIQLNDRILVPSREVFEAMGAKVGWNHANKQVTVEYKNKKVTKEELAADLTDPVNDCITERKSGNNGCARKNH